MKDPKNPGQAFNKQSKLLRDAFIQREVLKGLEEYYDLMDLSAVLIVSVENPLRSSIPQSLRFTIYSG